MFNRLTFLFQMQLLRSLSNGDTDQSNNVIMKLSQVV